MAFTRPKAAQIDFDITNITDPLIRLNSGETGSADKDVGIVVERGSDTNVAIIWDESADQFVLVNTTETGTTSGNVTIASYAGVRANAIVYGSLNDGTTTLTATAAELNILDGVTATATELNYVSGVTSAIQTQINNISSSFTLAADSGSNDTFTTGETLTFTGGSGITTAVTNNTITINTSGAAPDIELDSATGNNTTTDFTVSTAPTAAEDLLVTINGLVQRPTTDYTVSGTTVTFGTAPFTGAVVAARTITAASTGPELSADTTPQLGGDLDINGFNITSANTNQDINIIPSGTGNVNITGNITSSGDLTVDTNTLYVDSTNNRVGVGTTSPSANLEIDAGSATGTHLQVTTTGSGHNIDITDSSSTARIRNASGFLRIGADHNNESADSSIRFEVDASEHMRIDSSGNVLFKVSALPSTGVGGAAFENDPSHGRSILQLGQTENTSTARTLVEFYGGSSRNGTIKVNNSSTSYNTSSDYRLKENVTATWDATTRLKQLNPVQFNFIADADTTVDGFLAHEVQSVVPEAISGTHDEVDDDGNPVYQGIDQSKLVPLLVKTIQELEARIVALENP